MGPRVWAADRTCDGSGLAATSITDQGLAMTATQAITEALHAERTDVVLRFPKGTCRACGQVQSTSTTGITRTHTDRKAPQ